MNNICCLCGQPPTIIVHNGSDVGEYCEECLGDQLVEWAKQGELHIKQTGESEYELI